MGGTNDPHNYNQQLRKELQRLSKHIACTKRGCDWGIKLDEALPPDADRTRPCGDSDCAGTAEYCLTPADARAIREWAHSLNGAVSTQQSRLVYLRTLARRALKGGYGPLTEMERPSDFYELHASLSSGKNPDLDSALSDNTLRVTRQAARLFFRDGLGHEWGNEINIGSPEPSHITEDDVLRSEEVEALFSAAANSRDKALMGLLLATGQRISATLSLRVRDVDLDGRTGFIYLNDEAIGLKGAAGKRPLLWASEYVTNWLDVHPYQDTPDAALFTHLKGRNRSDRDGTEALSPWGVNQAFRRIHDRTDLDKKVNPHSFRHSAITRMARDGVPEQHIKWMVGWKKDSSQFERYVHLRDDEQAQGVLEHYDIAEEDNDIGRPTLEECPRCDAALDAWVAPVACPGCGLSLSHRAADVADAAEEVEENATEAAIDSMDPQEIEALRAIREAVDDPAALAEKLAQLED